MSDVIDCWTEDDFEETVAAALIACFESKVKKNKQYQASARLDESSLKNARNRGLYIPSSSRVVINTTKFDMVNDKLPEFGCLALRRKDDGKHQNYHGYITLMSFAKRIAMPKGFFAIGRGSLYEMDYIVPNQNTVDGEKCYFTVNKDGRILACSAAINSSLGGRQGEKQQVITQQELEPHILQQVEANASFALQYIADKKFCWSISAQEKNAKATLGCMQEEIKSLLYARSLPMSANGRKRPILHLVEAHKRRMKIGTDVDITSFLRGQQTVEIGGTIFNVNPPKSIISTVSKGSQKFFERDA